jgi:hypothetical protein
MPNITLTTPQIETIIYNLAYSYTSFGDALSLNTAHAIAVESANTQYFNGIVKGLNIVYPIPVEVPDPVI